MENEFDEIKIKYNNSNHNLLNFNLMKNKIISLQILNLLSILLCFTFLINFIKDKNNSFNNKNIEKIDITNSPLIEDKLKLLKMITNNDELEYKGVQECLLKDRDKELCIYHLLSIKEVIGKKRILVGEKSDGCYVLLDDFENVKIAYSFGISINIQFDKALADKGIDIYMYDHTINSLPFLNAKFHWKKIGLCGVNKKYQHMKTLEELIIENGHKNENNMILKIDIEHWEWESLLDLKEDTLNQFKYIAIEYHFKDEKEKDNKKLYYNVLKKISKTHQPSYIRCNENRSFKINFGKNRICHIIEVSYIIKKGNTFKKDESIYPIYELDYKKPKLGKLEMNLNILKLFD